MKIVPSVKFIDDLDKLIKKNARMQNRVEKCLCLFSTNMHHPSLRFHKLAGLDKYSISIDMKIRMLFCFKDEDIHLLRIGTHDDVY